MLTLLLMLLQVTIGNQKYQCWCVRYVSDDIALIIGLSVGLALLLIIVLVIMVVSIAFRRDRSKPDAQKMSKYKAGASISIDNKDGPYSRQLPDDYAEYKQGCNDNRFAREPSDDYLEPTSSTKL